MQRLYGRRRQDNDPHSSELRFDHERDRGDYARWRPSSPTRKDERNEDRQAAECIDLAPKGAGDNHSRRQHPETDGPAARPRASGDVCRNHGNRDIERHRESLDGDPQRLAIE
jgi:hypothetical protein